MDHVSEFAARLNGREYGREITNDESAEAREAGLIVVFGYSDDGVEVRGFSDEEVGAYDGTTLHFTCDGLVKNECEDEDCPYFAKALKGAVTVEAKWHNKCPAWTFETEIPHSTFAVMESGEVFCIGIVFSRFNATPPDRRDRT